MTNNARIEAADQWLLMKRGLYERPGHCGYTEIRDHAGRYSEKEATECAVNGVTKVKLSDAPEFTAAPAEVEKMRAEVEAALAAKPSEEQIEAAAEVIFTRHDGHKWKARATAALAFRGRSIGDMVPIYVKAWRTIVYAPPPAADAIKAHLAADRVADGGGAAVLEQEKTEPDCTHPWAHQDANGYPTCAVCGTDWTNVMHPNSGTATGFEAGRDAAAEVAMNMWDRNCEAIKHPNSPPDLAARASEDVRVAEAIRALQPPDKS